MSLEKCSVSPECRLLCDNIRINNGCGSSRGRSPPPTKNVPACTTPRSSRTVRSSSLDVLVIMPMGVCALAKEDIGEMLVSTNIPCIDRSSSLDGNLPQIQNDMLAKIMHVTYLLMHTIVGIGKSIAIKLFQVSRHSDRELSRDHAQ